MKHLKWDVRMWMSLKLVCFCQIKHMHRFDSFQSHDPENSRRSSPVTKPGLAFSTPFPTFSEAFLKMCAVFYTEIIKLPHNFTIKLGKDHELITAVMGAQAVLTAPTLPATRNFHSLCTHTFFSQLAPRKTSLVSFIQMGFGDLYILQEKLPLNSQAKTW